jgi:glutamyl-tRNA reductase
MISLSCIADQPQVTSFTVGENATLLHLRSRLEELRQEEMMKFSRRLSIEEVEQMQEMSKAYINKVLTSLNGLVSAQKPESEEVMCVVRALWG